LLCKGSIKAGTFRPYRRVKVTFPLKEAIVDDREIERRAKILWTQENPGRPWIAVAQRLQLGEDLSTGATEEDRERYRQRVRYGE
jgi:hypothetical protein